MSRISINKESNTASQSMTNTVQRGETYMSPLCRLGSLKNVSMKGVSFSQHLFGHENYEDLKVSSSTSFKSEKWSFERTPQIEEKSSLTRSCKMQGNNPFLKARLAYAKKDSAKDVTRRSDTLDEDSAEQFKQEEAKTTFRLIRKRTLNETIKRTSDDQF